MCRWSWEGERKDEKEFKDRDMVSVLPPAESELQGVEYKDIDDVRCSVCLEECKRGGEGVADDVAVWVLLSSGLRDAVDHEGESVLSEVYEEVLFGAAAVAAESQD